ncbi:MAG: HAMP domain-containing sensor histidine kinase [Rhodothermales bacterium]|nr:HAMP domain-containing sensor histidine kinase [Rhodothermales bacterium]
MLSLPSTSPATLVAFLLAVAFLGALCTLSMVLAVARWRPHLLPAALLQHLAAEQSLLQRALSLVQNKEAQAERMQAALLDNVSHEFRTPLTGILAAAQMLREGVDTEQRELTEMIIRDGQRMHATLSNVLELVEMEAAAPSVHSEPFDLADEIRAAVAPFAPFAARKGIVLVGPPANASFTAVSDPAMLRKVIGNLVDNAIKFTEAGEVRVGFEPMGDWIRVDVADTGIGIAQPQLPHLFVPFSQGSQGLNRAYAGTGLGLSLTKRMVDLMGGTLTITSEPGTGSVFSVALPREAGAPAGTPHA